ncbi:MAG: sulfate permease [Reichenbachiella sp.]|uniref:SulP family inorganic anion transporter n=1 Tax=Reichenbachiella sp. TaxID=2184521 RepID=UPI0032646CB1
MENLFPFISSMKSYDRAKLTKDLAAGLVVGVMLIPQGMAYAMIAGLPPVFGLYAAIFPSLIYTFLGSSRHVSVGPVAMDSLILFAGISAVAAVGSDQYIAMAVAITTIVGLIQLTMGLLRMGFLANFLSKPVILGFTFAAAVLISIKQIKYLIKVEADASNIFRELAFYFTHFHEIHLSTFLLSVVSIVVLFFGKKIFPRIPMSLLVVLLGTLSSFLFDFEQLGIELVGGMPSGFPVFDIPDWEVLPVRQLLPLIFTLALMGFVEVYSIGQRLQSKHKGEYEIDPNRELIGIGAGNIVGSFFKSFPTTAGFSRSAVNEASGAQTGLAALVSVLVVIMTLLFLMPAFYYLPQALLGAIIFVAILGLIDYRLTKKLWKNDKYDFAMLLSSFAGTLILGIEWGIGVGILLSLVVLIYKTSTPHMAVLGRIEGTSYFRNLNRYDTAIDDPKVSILRFDARLFFANIGSLKSKMDELVSIKPQLEKIILDAQSISDIDSSGMEGLEDLISILKDNQITFHMANIIGPVRDKLFISGLADKIGLENIHDSIADALMDHTTNTKLAYQTNIK